MTESEKVTLTTALVDNDIEATPEIVAVYLSVAKDAILKRRYPFGGCECCYVPAEYEVLQCQLAARYFLRRGGEGEVAQLDAALVPAHDFVITACFLVAGNKVALRGGFLGHSVGGWGVGLKSTTRRFRSGEPAGSR